MKFLKQIAIGLLAAELILATVLVVGVTVPLPGKIEFKIVQSGSMEPELPVGSVVFIVPQLQYAVGDIITFGDDTTKRIPTTHRVVERTSEAGYTRYLTKGDANEEADNGITTYPEIIGKVVLDVPRLGYVLDFARSKNGFTFMVLIPALLIIVDELITVFTALRPKQAVVVTPQKSRAAPLRWIASRLRQGYGGQALRSQRRRSTEPLLDEGHRIRGHRAAGTDEVRTVHMSKVTYVPQRASRANISIDGIIKLAPRAI